MEYWQRFIELTQLEFFPQILNLVNIFLIFLTAFVAYLSWRAVKKANELQLLPLLAIYFRGDSMKDRKIRIRNIGKSPAYDIQIESFINILRDIQKVWRLDLAMTGTNVLVPDEEKDLYLKATSNGKEASMGDFMVFHLDPEEGHQRGRIGLILTFRNAEGNYYYSKVETGLGGLFVRPAKRLNVLGRLYLNYRRFSENALLCWYKFIWKFREPYVEQPRGDGRRAKKYDDQR